MNKKYIKGILGAVLLFAGLFPCHFSARAQTPGGVVPNANYTWKLWLTPETYNNGTWVNKITGLGTAGNFVESSVTSHKAPAVVAGFNFHQAAQFAKTSNGNAFNRLISTNVMSIPQGENVTTIIVYERANTTYYDYLFSFNDGDVNGDLVFYESNNNLRLYWPGTNRGTVAATGKGIVAVSIANNATGATVLGYVDGGTAQSRTGGQLSSSYNSKWALGANGSAIAAGYGFEGKIQEVIVLKAGGTGNHIEPADLLKIHSYLAIKYGIKMNNTSNYVNSAGAPVWNYNSGYNFDIFGLGHDNASGLYQKQSHNSEKTGLTAFVGPTKTTFNSQNTGTISNEQYLMIGANSAAILRTIDIAAGTTYENAEVDASSQDLNIGSPIYLTQLTGAATFDVKFALSASYGMFTYAFVSTEETFNPSNTKLYRVVDGVVNVTVDQTYKFIRFAGIALGPGGVNADLRLWLRADEDGAVTYSDLDKTDPKVLGLPNAPADADATVPAVSSWQDFVRGHNYTFADGPPTTVATNPHRMPVLQPNSYEMNYHPAVQFYANTASSGTNFTSYLSNSKGLLAAPKPVGGKHTAYFVVNNDFGRNAWVYPLGFHNNNTTPIALGGGIIPRPAWGVQKVTVSSNVNNTVGRFRTSTTEVAGSKDMFSVGATTILGYKTNTNGNTGNPTYFRFNGRDETVTSTTFSWSNIDFTNGSIIGSAYSYDRTILGVMSEVIIYENELSDEDRNRLESYLAIKYGITLRPDNTTTKRFDYKFSDGDLFWNGDSNSSPYAFFYNNIGAVIRDDAAKLSNRHAHSTDAGSLLHMGVAGTILSDNTDNIGDFDYDMEAVSWGHNGAANFVQVQDPEDVDCGEFEFIFNRKWLIHKSTFNNRPISMLVGAQNNSGSTIGGSGSSAGEIAAGYYAQLHEGNDFYLIVATSVDNLNNNVFKAVVPMSYINGEHQCNYIFTDEDTYITFAYKSNGRGCLGEVKFDGKKVFDWTQYTTNTNTSTSSATPLAFNSGVAGPVTGPGVAKNLGDGIVVKKTTIAYPSPIRTSRNYPRTGNLPERGSLDILRRYGSVGQPVEITVEFNTPVMAEFSISGLSGASRRFERVEITGECDDHATIYPTLSYSGDSRKASYTISANRATVKKNGSMAGGNLNGKVNIAFKSGVQKITIKYSIINAVTSSVEHIYISPISLRHAVPPPPPPINEDGLSFVKQVSDHELTTCEPVEYSFEIQNINCDSKYVSFTDVLPAKMKWKIESLALGEDNELNNTHISINEYGGSNTLHIDSLRVHGARTLRFTATALLDEDAPTGTYNNRAVISYERIIEGASTFPTLESLDRETLDPYTSFDAALSTRQEEVQLLVTTNSSAYRAGHDIEIIYTIKNDGDPIGGMYLNMDYNEGFTYVTGSFTKSPPALDAHCVLPDLETPPIPSLLIAGAADGSSGFTLPHGETVFKVKLLAPTLLNLEEELDEENGLPTGKIVDLEVAYNFSTESSDPCVILSINKLQGRKLVPYSAITHIKTNKTMTTTIKKQR